MNKDKEIDHYREYSTGSGRCYWDSPLHAWLTRAKLDRTEELEEVLNDIKIFALTGHHGSHAEKATALKGILKMIDKALAELEDKCPECGSRNFKPLTGSPGWFVCNACAAVQDYTAEQEES